ncbi:MAG TPA: hypothetical protein VHM26_02015 [Chitinophagaceae bacterium]|nr:hypothetical protein [Chitinophagaceae bacterium]
MKISVVFAALSLLLVKTAFTQTIDQTIATYAEKFSQERVYIHYDKSSYAPGETIWFKAYLMDGINPAGDSKNFYVDFTDEKGVMVSRMVLPIVDANTNGQLEIPLEYKGTYLHVKAYTKWMLNFDTAFLYNRDIRIIGGKPAAGVASPKPAIIPTLEFFPEGGDLVEGIPCRIAFKANDQWGRPVKIKGSVYSSNGTKLDSLRIAHDGMGTISITPNAGETYIAKWKDEKGAPYTTTLPATKSNGVSLYLQFAPRKRNLNVVATPAVASALGTVNIIGTMNQHMVFKVARDITKGNAGASIPVQDLPSGILTLTVFDQQWKPLAERITFVNNEEYAVNPSMEVTHWGLSKRARNEITITVPDSIPTNLSISVTDVDIDSDSSNTIVSGLLLSSDIKGRVHNPAYYFKKNDDATQQQLDLVMMTNGWRRFKWEDVAQNKLPKLSYQRDTSYLTLSGQVYGLLPQQYRDAGEIILFVKPKTGQRQMMMLPINARGEFNDPGIAVFDSVHIYYQFLNKKKMGDASVQFMTNLLPPLKNNLPANGYFNNQLSDTAGFARHRSIAEQAADLIRYEGKVLGNVVVTAKKKAPLELMDEKYASGLFTGGDGYKFDLVNDPFAASSFNIFQYLQSKVPGLQINPTDNPPSATWRGSETSLFLDEISATPDLISNIPVSDVAFIKVMRPPFMGAMGGGPGGAIAIYTRKGDDVKHEAGKGLANSLVRGYTDIRQFYSPNYSTFKPENEKKDIRTTLYWNPQLKTDGKSNKVKLTFYNNDISRAFRVIIEGMTMTGRLAHLETIME